MSEVRRQDIEVLVPAQDRGRRAPRNLLHAERASQADRAVLLTAEGVKASPAIVQSVSRTRSLAISHAAAAWAPVRSY
jgi:hypothetical protein